MTLKTRPYDWSAYYGQSFQKKTPTSVTNLGPVEHLPEYLKDFFRCGFEIGWPKGALQTLRWPDVTDDVLYLRAENSKSRKPDSVPLEGELREIIERRRAAAVWQSKNGQAHFSE